MSDVSTQGLANATPPNCTSLMQTASILVLICGVILFFDIGGELHAAVLYPESLSALALLHLGTEFLASLALAAAFVILRREIRIADRSRQRSEVKLGALRSDFDSLVRKRFDDWKLTRSESDIALLTLRGLKIAEIAEMRHTQIGTIKSQLSTIFRKSGVSTRTELVASFIEEFLDFAAAPSVSAPPNPQTTASTAPTMSPTT